MLSKAILLSLLASTTFALSADSTLPSFALAGPETPTPVGPTSTPQPVTTSPPAENDESTRSTRVPASLSFNPSDAPAFTPSSGAIDFSTAPAFPSTPCASTISIPSYTPTADLSIGQPIPSSFSSAPKPTPATENEGENNKEPCDQTPTQTVTVTASRPASTPNATPLSAAIPVPSSKTLSTIIGANPNPTPNHPSLPTIPTGLNPPNASEGHPGPGSGRPHPSARYSRYPSRPQISSGTVPVNEELRPKHTGGPAPVENESPVGQGVPAKPSSTPCTLSTLVRAEPTGL